MNKEFSRILDRLDFPARTDLGRRVCFVFSAMEKKKDVINKIKVKVFLFQDKRKTKAIEGRILNFIASTS